MYHSITIGDKNTWDDWHMIPTTRPIVTPPSVTIKQAEVPGYYGVIDLTEVLTGKPIFTSRGGSWDFVIPPDTYTDWQSLYSELMTYMHGQRHRVILEDDPTHYYIGRLQFESWTSGKNYSTVRIKYTFDPYRYDVETTECGRVKCTGTGTKKLYIPSTGMHVTLQLKAQAIDNTINLTLIQNGKSVTCTTAGEFESHLLYADENDNTISVSGTGIVSASYRGGSL